MLTKNAKNFILYALMRSAGEGTSSPALWGSFTLTNTEGTGITTGYNYTIANAFINALNHMSKAGTSDATTYIKCGTGTTAATEDDYDLEVEATDLSCDVATTDISGSNTKIYTTSFSNTSDSDIMVTEIGFFCNSYTGDGYGKFLLDRIVLDTPITIPAGGSKPITYELGF
jgi:hypothetical protein